MKDAVLVRLAEALGDLTRELEGLELGHAALLEPLGQALPGQQLHHHVRAAILGLAVLVHANGRRVAQLRGDLELAPEAGHELGVLQALAPHQLDRDLAIDLRVVGLVDHTHAALADDLLDPVAAPDRLADVVVEGHFEGGRRCARRRRDDWFDFGGAASGRTGGHRHVRAGVRGRVYRFAADHTIGPRAPRERRADWLCGRKRALE